MFIEQFPERKFLRAITFVVIITFFSSVVLSDHAPAPRTTVRKATLAPQHMVFGPLIEAEIAEKGMAEALIMKRISNQPELLTSERERMDLFSKLVYGKELSVYFSKTEKLDIDAENLNPLLEGVYIVPVAVESTLYFSLIKARKDGYFSCKVETLGGIKDTLGDFSKRGLLTLAEAAVIVDRISDVLQKRSGKEKFVDNTDEAVQASLGFLDVIGAVSMREELASRVRARNVIMGGHDAVASEKMYITHNADAYRRAVSILEKLYIANGIYPGSFKEAFQKYWQFREAGQESDFDIDEVDPKLKLLMMAGERGAPGASNEFGLMFRDEAFTDIYDIQDVNIEDCADTIDYIKEIFRKVAEHEMPEGLKKKYDLHILYQSLDESVKEERYEDAAVCQEKISVLERDLGMYNAARPETKAKLDRIFKKIPGLNPDTISVEKWFPSLTPTDIVVYDGTIKFNENFVKVMHKLSLLGLKGEKGLMRDYPPAVDGKTIGELFSSIIYSIAVHTLRGHFYVLDDGTVHFIPSEWIAQGERGKSHLYANILAMLFYWIVMVERRGDFRREAFIFINNNPKIFRKLSEEDVKRLPKHLVQICEDLSKRGVFPYPAHRCPTGATAFDAEDIIKTLRKKYVYIASNEGSAEDIEIWADAVLDIFLEGARAKEMKAQGKKMILAVEDDWMPEVQKTLIGPLMQELNKLGASSAISVVRKERGETVENFALRLERMRQEKGLDPADIVVIASEDNIRGQLFGALRTEEGPEGQSPLLVGVNNHHLRDNTYVSFMEMVTMAMRLALGQSPISDHPNIRKETIGERAFIFMPIPPAKPLNYDQIKDIYDKQLKIIRAA